MYKFEDVAEVGDRIRAYDFRGETAFYIEGVVKEKDVKGKITGYACFVIEADVDVWSEERKTARIGRTCYVPMEVAYSDWDGRVVKVS